MVRIVGLIFSVTMGAGMTLGLFYFMHTLITTGDQIERKIDAIPLVNATMPEIEMEVIEEIDKPQPIELVSEPPEPERKHITLDTFSALIVERNALEVDSELDLSMASIAATDGDILPIVAVAPVYPENARIRRIEGWCLVKFTVDARGNVAKDTIEVVDAEPPIVFDRSSIRAAARFRFQPRIIDGVGVEVPEVQYLFNYREAKRYKRSE